VHRVDRYIDEPEVLDAAALGEVFTVFEIDSARASAPASIAEVERAGAVSRRLARFEQVAAFKGVVVV
jgi:hypothetical protein